MRNACVGVLWDSIDRLSLWAAAWWSGGTAADTAARALVLRYGLLSHALLFKEARGQLRQSPNVADAGLSDLVALRLLKIPEAEQLAPLPSKAHVVWAWQAAFWACAMTPSSSKGCKKAGETAPSSRLTSIPHAAHLVPLAMEACARARDAISIGMTYVNTQQPFAYVHMLAFSVWIATTINALLAGLKMAYLDPKLVSGCFEFPQLASWPLIFSCVARVILLPLMYDGLLGLAITLENPFQSSSAASCFPSELFEHEIHSECSAMAMGVDCIDPLNWWPSTGVSFGSRREHSSSSTTEASNAAAQQEWDFGPKTRHRPCRSGDHAPGGREIFQDRARVIARVGTLSRFAASALSDPERGTSRRVAPGVIPLARLPESRLGPSTLRSSAH